MTYSPHRKTRYPLPCTYTGRRVCLETGHTIRGVELIPHLNISYCFTTAFLLHYYCINAVNYKTQWKIWTHEKVEKSSYLGKNQAPSILLPCVQIQTLNQGVQGSSPWGCTKQNPIQMDGVLLCRKTHSGARRERPEWSGGKKPSGEWFFSSPGWRRHCPSDAGSPWGCTKQNRSPNGGLFCYNEL